MSMDHFTDFFTDLHHWSYVVLFYTCKLNYDFISTIAKIFASTTVYPSEWKKCCAIHRKCASHHQLLFYFFWFFKQYLYWWMYICILNVNVVKFFLNLMIVNLTLCRRTRVWSTETATMMAKLIHRISIKAAMQHTVLLNGWKLHLLQLQQPELQLHLHLVNFLLPNKSNVKIWYGRQIIRIDLLYCVSQKNIWHFLQSDEVLFSFNKFWFC